MIMCDKMHEIDRNYKTRMSSEQKAHLIEYMGNNTDFARRKLMGLKVKTTYCNMWEILAEELNSLGPRKSATKWKRAWFDLKSKVRRKARKTTLISKTKGGPPSTPLTKLDEKLINLISEEPVFELHTKDVIEQDVPLPISIVETVLTTSWDPTDDHDYCTKDSDNNDIVLADKDEAGSKASTQSYRTIGAAPGCSTPGNTSTKKESPNPEEAIEYFQSNVSKFDKKIDTVIAQLRDNNDTLKETNKLLQELIRVIREK